MVSTAKRIKILAIGSEGVGKRCLLQRYAEGSFPSDDGIISEIFEKQVEADSINCWVSLWNLHEKEISQVACENADACVIMFSTTDPESFYAIDNWIGEVKRNCDDIPMVLVQTKIDLLDEQTQLMPIEVEAKARELKLRLYRTSAKDDLTVLEVFEYLLAKCLGKFQTQTSSESLAPPRSGSRAGSAQSRSVSRSSRTSSATNKTARSRTPGSASSSRSKATPNEKNVSKHNDKTSSPTGDKKESSPIQNGRPSSRTRGDSASRNPRKGSAQVNGERSKKSKASRSLSDSEQKVRDKTSENNHDSSGAESSDEGEDGNGEEGDEKTKKEPKPSRQRTGGVKRQSVKRKLSGMFRQLMV